MTTNTMIIMGLCNKLPYFNPEWPNDRKDQWFAAFALAWRLAYRMPEPDRIAELETQNAALRKSLGEMIQTSFAPCNGDMEQMYADARKALKAGQP